MSCAGALLTHAQPVEALCPFHSCLSPLSSGLGSSDAEQPADDLPSPWASAPTPEPSPRHLLLQEAFPACPLYKLSKALPVVSPAPSEIQALRRGPAKAEMKCTEQNWGHR